MADAYPARRWRKRSAKEPTNEGGDDRPQRGNNHSVEGIGNHGEVNGGVRLTWRYPRAFVTGESKGGVKVGEEKPARRRPKLGEEAQVRHSDLHDINLAGFGSKWGKGVAIDYMTPCRVLISSKATVSQVGQNQKRKDVSQTAKSTDTRSQVGLESALVP